VVAGAGDVNGDAFADVLVAAPMTMTATGRVYLYLGRAIGLPTVATTVLTGPDGTLSDFGVGLAPAGDVNGDGYGDVVVGADRVGAFAGRVYLFLGGATGLATTPAATLVGNVGTEGNLGAAVAGTDLNGDGFADLAVSSYNATTGGRVRVFNGSAAGLVTASPAVIAAPDGMRSAFGATLRGAGDVNGDGVVDLVVGGSQAAGGSAGCIGFPGGRAGWRRARRSRSRAPSRRPRASGASSGRRAGAEPGGDPCVRSVDAGLGRTLDTPPR
jgi:hypothetical protein